MKKIICEICGENNTKILEKHHIIPRTELGCTNHEYNLAIICANCHAKHHVGDIKIIGFVSSSKPPYKRTLVYEENGKRNISSDIEVIIIKPKEMKVYGRN
jgi:5-methylcytosine-specific restriction endonuclease McrA